MKVSLGVNKLSGERRGVIGYGLGVGLSSFYGIISFLKMLILDLEFTLD